MKYTGVIPASIEDVRGFSDIQLAAALGVDEVIAGPDAEWYTASSSYYERGALVVLPDPNADPREEPQFARTWTCKVAEQGEQQFLVESYRDDNLIADVVQARSWFNVVALNQELCYVLWGFDDLNATSTSSTTTST
jgi:hypothetical protein